MLTVLLPTRNRAPQCSRQLRFLSENKFPYRIIVLDGSDAVAAVDVRAASEGIAEYRHFDPFFRMADKLAAAVTDVETPFVLLIPDDDIVLPHAIEQEIAFLKQNPGFIAAHGYFLGFRDQSGDIDVYDPIGFTPSIVDDEPLLRHYNLFRRYQSFYWGVFRTAVFAAAVTAACAMDVVLFRELTVMSTSILQGKVARLSLVHALRGTAPSHAALDQSHPLFWFLNDARSFFRNYVRYRDGIARFIRSKGIAVPHGVALEQLLDVIHSTWLGREIDVGMMNHQARILLGESLPPIQVAQPWADWRTPEDGDLVHSSARSGRRYVWRRRVVAAEPVEEIVITPEEMARVERQLDSYR
jgi:glycosyltransferase domain-containing protein